MATVHRAKKQGIEGFERVVALKRLLEHLSEDEAFVRSFVREARLASYLQHSNIVQIYDLGRVDHIYFIAMEYVSGQDLRMVLRQCAYGTGPMPVPLAINLVMQLCDALDYAHNLADEGGEPFGIVHRDISPANVIIAADGTAKVIDFGIAKATSSKLLSQTGGIKGKFSYMPPEALSGEPLDARSDLFSLGVVAHELLTARPLFSGGSEFETLRRVQTEVVEPPSRHNPQCPHEIDEIVLHALAKTRAERWQSASAMRNALDSVATRLGLRAANRDVAAWVKWAFAQPLSTRRWDADRNPPGANEVALADEVSEVSIVVEVGAPVEALEAMAPVSLAALSSPASHADAPTIPPAAALTPAPAPAPAPAPRESAPYASMQESRDRDSGSHAALAALQPNKTMVGTMVPVVAAPPAAGPHAQAHPAHPQPNSYDAQRAMMTVMPGMVPGLQYPPGIAPPPGMMPAYEPSGRPEFTPQTAPIMQPPPHAQVANVMQPTLVPQNWAMHAQQVQHVQAMQAQQAAQAHAAQAQAAQAERRPGDSQPVTSQKEYLAAAAVYNAQENAKRPSGSVAAQAQGGGGGGKAAKARDPVKDAKRELAQLAVGRRAKTEQAAPERRTGVWLVVILAGAAAAAGGFFLVAHLRAKDPAPTSTTPPGAEAIAAPQAVETPAVPVPDGTAVRLCVDAAGAVTSVETPLAEDAVAALRRWRFAATEAGCFTTTTTPR